MSEALLERYFGAFALHDADTMADCYHPQARFLDPIFTLEGERIGMMWRMLLSRSDLTLEHEVLEADLEQGQARWHAHYTFSRTRRTVHNAVQSRFRFQGGKILEQHDSFDFHRWAAQALGPSGQLLGWSTPLRRRVRDQALERLERYVAHYPELRPGDSGIFPVTRRRA